MKWALQTYMWLYIFAKVTVYAIFHFMRNVFDILFIGAQVATSLLQQRANDVRSNRVNWQSYLQWVWLYLNVNEAHDLMCTSYFFQVYLCPMKHYNSYFLSFISNVSTLPANLFAVYVVDNIITVKWMLYIPWMFWPIIITLTYCNWYNWYTVYMEIFACHWVIFFCDYDLIVKISPTWKITPWWYWYGYISHVNMSPCSRIAIK